MAMGHTINRKMASWDDSKWDELIGIVKTIPPALTVKLLQSEFPITDWAWWLVKRPGIWPKMIVSTAKLLVSHLRSR